MFSRSIVALTAPVGIRAAVLSAQQPSSDDVCLKATCLKATVELSQPTVVLVVPSPDAALPDSALPRFWEQRVGELYRAAQRAAAATGFALEVRAPALSEFHPTAPQLYRRLAQGYVIISPGQRAVVLEEYLDEEALERALTRYRSPVQPLEQRPSK